MTNEITTLLNLLDNDNFFHASTTGQKKALPNTSGAQLIQAIRTIAESIVMLELGLDEESKRELYNMPTQPLIANTESAIQQIRINRSQKHNLHNLGA
jgi:hypothetical protein